jgi:hypothetical protein
LPICPYWSLPIAGSVTMVCSNQCEKTSGSTVIRSPGRVSMRRCSSYPNTLRGSWDDPRNMEENWDAPQRLLIDVNDTPNLIRSTFMVNRARCWPTIKSWCLKRWSARNPVQPYWLFRIGWLDRSNYTRRLTRAYHWESTAHSWAITDWPKTLGLYDQSFWKPV